MATPKFASIPSLPGWFNCSFATMAHKRVQVQLHQPAIHREAAKRFSPQLQASWFQFFALHHYSMRQIRDDCLVNRKCSETKLAYFLQNLANRYSERIQEFVGSQLVARQLSVIQSTWNDHEPMVSIQILPALYHASTASRSVTFLVVLHDSLVSTFKIPTYAFHDLVPEIFLLQRALHLVLLCAC
jgi:hypothetical protein